MFYFFLKCANKSIWIFFLKARCNLYWKNLIRQQPVVGKHIRFELHSNPCPGRSSSSMSLQSCQLHRMSEKHPTLEWSGCSDLIWQRSASSTIQLRKVDSNNAILFLKKKIWFLVYILYLVNTYNLNYQLKFNSKLWSNQN